MIHKYVQNSILAQDHICHAAFKLTSCKRPHVTAAAVATHHQQSNISQGSSTNHAHQQQQQQSGGSNTASGASSSTSASSANSLQVSNQHSEPFYLCVFSDSKQAQYALLLLSEQLVCLDVIPLEYPCTIKITTEESFSLFLRKSEPRVYRFSMDRGDLWNCVSMLGNICTSLSSSGEEDSPQSRENNSSTSTGSAASSSYPHWLRQYESFMHIQQQDTNSMQGHSHLSRGAASSSPAQQFSNRTNLHNHPSRRNAMRSPQSPRRFIKPSQATLKEDWVNTQMTNRRSEYTEQKKMNVLVGTFNVNSKYPSDHDTNYIRQWLQINASKSVSSEYTQQHPDIIFIGLQEVDMSASAVLKEQTEARNSWDQLLSNALNSNTTHHKSTSKSDSPPQYHLVVSRQLVGLYSVLFINKKYSKPDVLKDVRCAAEGVGVMGLGNKGAVSVRFELFKSTFCFINSHLAPHINNVERRNQNYFDILRRTTFNGDKRYYHPDKHDFFFWIGDLNYRPNLDYDTTLRLLKEGKYSDIVRHDQLTIEKSKPNNCFPHFDEAPINFPCTYRFDTGTDNYDTSEKRRVPAYTDRVLWKQNSLIENRTYTSFPELKFSDHKPISASFSVPVQVVIRDKMKRIHSEIIKQLDKMENDMLPEVTVSNTDFRFNDVRFEEVQTKTIVLENVGRVVCEFCFVPKPNEDIICKDWIEFDPPAGIIIPQQKVEIQLSVNVQMESAHALNRGSDSIDDILILHLKNGRDHFISVQGNWMKTCFGNSIEHLIKQKYPIRDPSGTQETLSLDQRPAVPKELFRICKYLYDNGLETSRIFKSEGSSDETHQLRDILDTGSSFDDYHGSCVSVAETIVSLLKNFEEPVIPYHYYHKVIEAGDEGYEACLNLVMSIDESAHYNVFAYTISLLREVLKHSKKNDTTPEELSILFSDVFIRKKEDTPSHMEQSMMVKFVRAFLDPNTEPELGPLRPLSA